MSLRINTNIAAQTSLRSLDETDRNLTASLERLSTGFRINRGADSPAGLVISEQMRGQIAGINQAIANSEQATAMVRTSEGALTEINNLLIRMRELALHASNEGANDEKALEADQLEVVNAVETMARIATTAQFGTRRLLDGSSGISGSTQGEGLDFVAASVRTKTSPVEGYRVEITQPATRSFVEGSTEITESNLPGLTLTLAEAGRTVQIVAAPGDSVGSFFGKLKTESERAGLAVDLEMSPEGLLRVTHKEYGSKYTFQVASSVAGVLSEQGGVVQQAVSGQDVRGFIGSETAEGQGQLLRGLPGNANTEGLSVRYVGPIVEVGTTPDGRPILDRRPQVGIVGTVNVANNAPEFQIGPNPGQRASIALPNAAPQYLGRQVQNESGFRSLADINLKTGLGARESIRIIDSAIDELTLSRGQLGAFERNGLEKNIAALRVTAENMSAAESGIRDADIAKELTTYTRNRILFEANAAMLAQANQVPRTVVDLIR
ncbi:MAG: flagellin [Candidatus Lambdaproteobacteria bacterium]|nr:flagellin [Candidatus Lambdaproteobacteria bacterium]